MMRIDHLARRVEALEAREAARPVLPALVLCLERDAQALYANGQRLDRLPGETGPEFLARAQRACPRSKRCLGLVTSTPPQAGS